jgi:hypothetical protein
MALLNADRDDPEAWAGAKMLTDLWHVVRAAALGNKAQE